MRHLHSFLNRVLILLLVLPSIRLFAAEVVTPRKEVEQQAQTMAISGTENDFANIVGLIRSTRDKQLRKNLFSLLLGTINKNMCHPILDDVLVNESFVLEYTKILGHYESKHVIPYLVMKIQTQPSLDMRGAFWILWQTTPDAESVAVLWDAADRIPRDDTIVRTGQNLQQDLKSSYYATIANSFSPENYTAIFDRLVAGRFTKFEEDRIKIAYGERKKPTDLTWHELAELYRTHQPLRKSR